MTHINFFARHKCTRAKSTLLIIILMCALTFTSTVVVNAASTVVRQNVSSSPVSVNASKGKLPESAKVYSNFSYYINLQTNLNIKKATLYLCPVGSSKYSTFTENAKNYFRYAYFKKQLGSKAGNAKYYWRYTLTNGKSYTTSVQTIYVNDGTTYKKKIVNYSSNTIDDFLKKENNAIRSIVGFKNLSTYISSGKVYYYNRSVISDRRVLKTKIITMRVAAVQGPKPPTKTIKVRIPTQIEYTIHTHNYKNKVTSSAAGRLMYGLVNQQLSWTQTCDCGESIILTWDMPDIDFKKVSGGSTYNLITTTRVKR